MLNETFVKIDIITDKRNKTFIKVDKTTATVKYVLNKKIGYKTKSKNGIY
jgi:hypothetical protein